ncbi:MAG TPA: HAMP domain-containing sensor histidine kinase [Candidatus Binatia bacterium]
MRNRNPILIPLFLLATICALVLALASGGSNATGLALQGFLKSVIWLPLANLFAVRPDGAARFWLSVDENKGVIFYGALGFFGLFMAGLVVRSALRSPADKIEASLLKALIQEKEKAEHTAKIKSEFLAQVSHELRTPLAVIMGYVECLIDGLYGDIDAEHRNILSMVSKQSTELKSMIDQILLFSRLEAGKQELRIETFRLGEMVDELRQTYDFLARQKGIEMSWPSVAEIPELKTDPERVKEILNNLLQNALKYTERGSIYLRIRHRPDADSMAFEVTDTGIGIAQLSLDTIFDPFVRAHKESAYEAPNGLGGIGMGLAIVKKDVEQLNGTITVESRLQYGTSFKVLLPRILVEPQKQPAKRGSAIIQLLLGHGARDQSDSDEDSSESSARENSAAASGGRRN